MSTRLAALASLALLAAVPAAHGALQAAPAAVGLKGFLLRADEPTTHTFPRTPAFAWTPYRGAIRYDFELSTSSTFDESSRVWSTRDMTRPLRTPVVSIPVSLPWMTGKPYGLYARVRAVTRGGRTPWSTSFGFNMSWTNMPDQITPEYAGLVRWTPVAGATEYEVWFIDASKVITTMTNVADEREYYTFHQDSSWTGTVHWRVRAVRRVYGELPNGLPAVVDGPWSTTYTSTNDPLTTGAFSLTATVSDAVRLPTDQNPPAHGLMPAFVFSGDVGVDGTSVDLYRVYVATDQACVNIVYRGSIVGSPAYAPRLTGALALPTTPAGETAAASNYLDDEVGTHTPGFAADYQPVTPTEQRDAGPGRSPDSPVSALTPVTPAQQPAPGTSGAAAIPPDFLAAEGPAIDLPDSGWPAGAYYWTVVPVEDVLDPRSGLIVYYDLETPQDACAAGRVLSFGKTSAPNTTEAGGKPFVTGLTPDGDLLTAGGPKPTFYGAPLIAWQPAPGATGYEVQWSPSLYPWKAVKSLFTGVTSTLLQGLHPGTRYYRVRGIDPYLPGVKQMAWSKPVAVVIAKPTFSVESAVPTASVKPATAPKTQATLKSFPGWSGGFAITLPASWKALSPTDPLVQSLTKLITAPYSLQLAVLDPNSTGGFRTNCNLVQGPGRGTTSFSSWANSLAVEARSYAGGAPVAQSSVTLPGGKAVELSFNITKNGHQIWQLQFVFDRGTVADSVTFTTLTSQRQKYASIFSRAAASVRFEG